MKKAFALALMGLGLGLGMQGGGESAFAHPSYPQYPGPAPCYAYTVCPNGYTIQCETYGSSCTWNVWPYQAVQCTGFDYWGRWINDYRRCW